MQFNLPNGAVRRRTVDAVFQNKCDFSHLPRHQQQRERKTHKKLKSLLIIEGGVLNRKMF